MAVDYMYTCSVNVTENTAVKQSLKNINSDKELEEWIGQGLNKPKDIFTSMET